MFDYSYNISGLNSAAKYPYQGKADLNTNVFDQTSIFGNRYPVDEYEDINTIMSNFWSNIYAQMASLGFGAMPKISKKHWAVNTKDLKPRMKDAMAELYRRAEAEGIDTKKIAIVSGYRTKEQQEYLYATKPAGMAAKPGTSMHEKGKAIDISAASPEDLKKLGKIWTEMGYNWGGNWKNHTENWHFDLKRTHT